MQLTPQQRVLARTVAREASVGSGTFTGVGLSLAFINHRVDVWLVGMIVIGLALSVLGFLLIPLYTDDAESDD